MQDRFQKIAEKNYEQGKGQFGIVASARIDLIGALYAIKDRPLLGYGSYAIDKDLKYRTKQFDFLHEYGYVEQIPNSQYIDVFFGTQVPSHSFLFDTMVSAGILGSIFWIFLTHFIVKNYVNNANRLPLFFHFMIVVYLNNLFFTPWAAVHRITLSLTIVLLILYIELINENISNSKKRTQR